MSRAMRRIRGGPRRPTPGPDLDPLDHVAGPDPVHGLHPRHHLAEEGEAPVEVRLRGERDEELAAAGVLAGERHADRPPPVGAPRDLAAQGVAGPAVAVAPRAPSLDDEAGLDPMEHQPVVEARAGEVDEGGRGERGFHDVEVYLHGPVPRAAGARH
jgi:hypothetical protein